MFIHYRTQGFILKKNERGEADRIFTIYTKDFGKLELLAKAERKIKSKLRSGLELFYLSEVEFIQGKAYKTLTDTILINNFKNLRKDFKKLKIAYQISEVLDNLVKGQEADLKIWYLLNEVFNKLNDSSFVIRHSSLLYYYFLWNLLSILGYQVELYNCALCQKKIRPEKISFSPEGGGIICGQCQTSIKTKRPIKSDTVKIIRILLKGDWSILKRLKVRSEDLKQLKMISNYYLSETLRQIE
jgi:DNA repair protein RecO (recombination protein O)